MISFRLSFSSDVLDKVLRIENAETVLVVIKTYVAKQKEKIADKIRTDLLNLRQISYEKAFKLHSIAFSKNAIKTEVKFNKSKEIKKTL
jgi:hypothetical protein